MSIESGAVVTGGLLLPSDSRCRNHCPAQRVPAARPLCRTEAVALHGRGQVSRGASAARSRVSATAGRSSFRQRARPSWWVVPLIVNVDPKVAVVVAMWECVVLADPTDGRCKASAGTSGCACGKRPARETATETPAARRSRLDVRWTQGCAPQLGLFQTAREAHPRQGAPSLDPADRRARRRAAYACSNSAMSRGLRYFALWMNRVI
jgi:hypothetical protein